MGWGEAGNRIAAVPHLRTLEGKLEQEQTVSGTAVDVVLVEGLKKRDLAVGSFDVERVIQKVQRKGR